MKMKIIVLLLILSSVLLSGCVGEEQPSPEENTTPQEETVTPEENVTVEENVTEEETITPAPEDTESEEVIPEENETAGESETVSPEIRENPYVIRLVNFRAGPSNLEIKEGEKVAWMNLQENPKRTFTLVSEQGLFENTSLVYKRAFVHTFNDTGDYSFKIVGQPKMDVTVTVVEP